MSRWIGDEDISKESQSRSKRIMFWAIAIISGCVIIFGLFWISFKLQHRVSDARSGFVTLLWWLFLGAIIVSLMFGLFALIIRYGARKKSNKEVLDNEED